MKQQHQTTKGAKMKNKFYEFKNITATSADLYIYGEIVEENWEKWDDDSGISLTEFKQELDKLGGILDLNIYINSVGGSVFASSTMVSLIERLKLQGTKVHTYVDGLCASASTFILFAGDDVNLYDNSIVMIHKPMTMAYGNADEIQKTVDTLNKIQDGVMLPLYEKKAKVSREELNKLINDETWLDAKEANEIFNVNLLNQAKQVTASISDKFKNVYKHIPTALMNETPAPKTEDENQASEAQKAEQTPNEQEQMEKTAEVAKTEPQTENVQAVDYSAFENTINNLKKGGI